MSSELRGTPAAPGAAVGTPWVHRPPSAGSAAARSLDDAAADAARELERLAAGLRDEGHPAEAEILDAQSLMAADPELLDPARAAIEVGTDPIDAVHAAGEVAAAALAALDDELLAARAADVRDVAARIARHIAGAPVPRLEQRSIAVAVDLPPSITVELDRSLLAGIALEGGSRTSHAAILSRSLGIPAVVGVNGLLDAATTAGSIAIDGDAGTVLVDPDAAAVERVAKRAAAARDLRVADAGLRDRPLATADGHRVVCAANVGSPEEAEAAFAAGAEAVGLFRTEFAFAGRRSEPDEELQADAYARAMRAAAGAPMIVRLVDIGGDKPIPYLPIPAEPNPFLGVRAIRLAGRHPELLPRQVRAILRASARVGAPAWIMAPMVADEDDLDLVRGIIAAARVAVPEAPPPRVGIMVEVPSAVLLADRLAARVDFLSIGTNDLTQYLLAADRSNPALAARQDPLHPAVLRAVARIVEAADSTASCEVSVCGEMAGDPAGALLLTGLGVAELSMDPGAFGAVKRALGERPIGDLRALAEAARAMRSAAEVRAAVGLA